MWFPLLLSPKRAIVRQTWIALSIVYQTMPKTKMKAVAATGNLSTGFREESLVRAMAQGANFVGCDAGTTDSGPYYLGSGKPRGPRDGVKRNLQLILREALKAGIPVIV